MVKRGAASKTGSHSPVKNLRREQRSILRSVTFFRSIGRLWRMGIERGVGGSAGLGPVVGRSCGQFLRFPGSCFRSVAGLS